MTLFSVDVETSGLNPFAHQVTAISVVEVETEHHVTARVVDSGHIFWDPSTRDWWEANKPATWRSIPPFHAWAVCEQITAFLEEFPKPWTFVAWPASFDYPFAQGLFETACRPWPPSAESCRRCAAYGPRRP
mgnify:CR=1 FL=1